MTRTAFIRATFCLTTIVLAAALLLWPSTTRAADVSYVYDEIGRLVRVIDADGKVATWTYDVVGNLLKIERTTVDQAQPSLSGITPNISSAPSKRAITLSGANLLGGIVTTDNPGILVSGTHATNGAITTTFTIAAAARQGPTLVTVNTEFGTASIPFTINPPASNPTLSPNLVELESKGKTTLLTVGLTAPVSFPTLVSLLSSDTSVATVTPTLVTIPANETSTTVTLTSRNAGFVFITADTGSGTTARADVIVAALPTGPILAVGSLVSVGLPPAPPSAASPIVAALVSVALPPAPPTTASPLVSALVSVALPAPLPDAASPLVTPAVSVALPAP
jgi:YD repeat-containing protein